MNKLTFLFLISLIVLSCHENKPAVSKDQNKNLPNHITIDGQRFIDLQGRQLILHGINVINKDPKTNYLDHVGQEDFAKFKSWGFNVIRLGIIWDGLEPEPGVYNEEYLKGIDEMVGWASDNGLYVFLDMHQDLYSVNYSDGAPSWATLDDDLPHYTGDIWSDSYLISPAVQTSFDNFWANAKTTSGKGVQDHYLKLWKHIAQRYAHNTTIIGYDIMNEPFMGSDANKVMPLLLQAYAQILVETTGQVPPSEEELLTMWGNPSDRNKALELLSEKEVYRTMIDAIYEVNSAFEKGVLTSFFQKARNAIREVDKNHIIFIEHNYFTNMGVASALQPILDENGKPDPLVAYAAHGYDLVVDTEAIAAGSNDRVDLIFERIAESAKRLDVPVLIGEWGALPNDNPNLTPVADFIMNQFNKHLFSDTYWAYGNHMEGAPYIEVLVKPYPVVTSGKLLDYSFDNINRVFKCRWEETPDVKAPTIVFIPDLNKVTKDNINLSPKSGLWKLNKIYDAGSGYLEITSSGEKKIRQLAIEFK